jgi:hypothetical protein
MILPEYALSVIMGTHMTELHATVLPALPVNQPPQLPTVLHAQEPPVQPAKMASSSPLLVMHVIPVYLYALSALTDQLVRVVFLPSSSVPPLLVYATPQILSTFQLMVQHVSLAPLSFPTVSPVPSLQPLSVPTVIQECILTQYLFSVYLVRVPV